MVTSPVRVNKRLFNKITAANAGGAHQLPRPMRLPPAGLEWGCRPAGQGSFSPFLLLLRVLGALRGEDWAEVSALSLLVPGVNAFRRNKKPIENGSRSGYSYAVSTS